MHFAPIRRLAVALAMPIALFGIPTTLLKSTLTTQILFFCGEMLK